MGGGGGNYFQKIGKNFSQKKFDFLKEINNFSN